MTIDEKIQLFFDSESRAKKEQLKEILKEPLTREHAQALAPAIRDRSPRISARITALLAKHRLESCFEEQLSGLKPGKQTLLRSQFRKIISRLDNS